MRRWHSTSTFPRVWSELGIQTKEMLLRGPSLFLVLLFAIFPSTTSFSAAPTILSSRTSLQWSASRVPRAFESGGRAGPRGRTTMRVERDEAGWNQSPQQEARSDRRTSSPSEKQNQVPCILPICRDQVFWRPAVENCFVNFGCGAVG